MHSTAKSRVVYGISAYVPMPDGVVVMGGGGVRDAAVDVVVIGAGVTGAVTAYYLVRRGFRVLVCEADVIASGATGLASGGVRSQFATELETRMSLHSRQLWQEFEMEHNLDLDYRQVGYLTIASDDLTEQELADRRRMQHEVGLNAVELTSSQMSELLPGVGSDDIRLAIFTPNDGFGSPADVTTTVLSVARDLGVRLRQRTRVVAVDTHDGRVTGVGLSDGSSVACGAVVNAAGHGAPAVGDMVGITLPVAPYRQHQFLTGPISDLDVARLPNVLDPALDLYLRGEGNSVLLGVADPAEAGRYDTSVTWSLLDRLAEQLDRRWPRLVEAGVARGWVGCYEVTPDRRALLGLNASVGGYVYAAGFSGHGFMHAFASGEIAAALVADEPPALDPRELSATRFEAANVG